MGKSTHFIGQPKPQNAEMDEETPDHRLHDHHPLLQPDFQGCRKASQDWEEEGWDQGAYGHPCQRGSALRHKVHIRSHQRLLHAQAGDPEQGRHHGDGPRIHRLREVRTAFRTGRGLRYEDEEVAQVQDAE